MRHVVLAASLCTLLLSACGVPTETIIRQEEIKVPVPVIRDTVRVTRVDTITVEAVKIVKGDTVVQVQYFPIEKKFYIKVKPDTVRITHTDTTQVIKPEIIETPFLSKMGIAAIGALAVIVVLVAVKLKLVTFPF